MFVLSVCTLNCRKLQHIFFHTVLGSFCWNTISTRNTLKEKQIVWFKSSFPAKSCASGSRQKLKGAKNKGGEIEVLLTAFFMTIEQKYSMLPVP